MATIHFIFIGNDPWWVARIEGVDVLRNRFRAGIVLDCLELGLIVEEA